MGRDPVAQLNLPALIVSTPDAEAAPPPAVQDFPPEAAAVADVGAREPISATLPHAGAPDSASSAFGVDPAAVLEQTLTHVAPLPLSALERYRLENDRELLRKLAYNRVFLNGRD